MKALFRKARIYGPRTFVPIALGEAKYVLVDRLLRGSYSQRGEDLVIDELLGYKRSGFYVDVGANDPFRFNNTARFYRRGWTGINIEPDPDVCSRLATIRSRDINLNIGIGLENCSLPFFRFFPDAFSTFSATQALWAEERGLELVDTIEVMVRRLNEVLSAYCEKREIDFVSIDAEGFEREVLLSNDWGKFRPSFVVVESKRERGGMLSSFEECNRILAEAGYNWVCDTGLNAIYRVQ